MEALADADLLAEEVTPRLAVDRALLLSSVELYFRATDGSGWSDDEYQSWLTETLRQQLLRPGLEDDSRSG